MLANSLLPRHVFHRQMWTAVLVGLLLFISTEVALRGEVMRFGWASLNTEQLEQFNQVNLCLGETGANHPAKSQHGSTHCLLCFLHIIPAAEPLVLGAFSDFVLYKLLAVQAAVIRDAFLKTISARGPPRCG